MGMARPALTETAPVTLQQLQSQWSELNTRYFGGALPPIEIVWSSRLTSSAGMFVSHAGPRSREDGTTGGRAGSSAFPRRCCRICRSVNGSAPWRMK